jgi:hypothetical protein
MSGLERKLIAGRYNRANGNGHVELIPPQPKGRPAMALLTRS